jgi:Transglycosylase SLT domain
MVYSLMVYTRSLISALFAVQALTADVLAGERAGLHDAPTVPDKLAHSDRPAAKKADPTAPLDRVASAVDGAESSHGSDLAMWRPDLSGPQGPMQVSEAAATDVGGGDRFNSLQNRAIGRAYLLQLYGRYGNWPDAIAAYNWGIGKMDAWVKAGRPPDQFLVGVAAYLRRVLHESGLCDAAEPSRRRQPSEGAREPGSVPPDSLVYVACSGPDASAGSSGFGGAPTRFSRKLDQALQLALQRAAQGR